MELKTNLFKKLSAITDELKTVGKNLKVSTGVSSYQAVQEKDILDAVKPLEFKYGVYSYPSSRTIIENQLIKKQTQKGESVQLMIRVEVVYRFVNVDDPSEFIEIVSYGDGIDSQDKAPGKAMTYADKYALMKAYKISTGEDTDASASEDNYYAKTNKSTPQPLTDEEYKVASSWNSKMQEWCCKTFKVYSIADLTHEQFQQIVKMINAKRAKQNENN